MPPATHFEGIGYGFLRAPDSDDTRFLLPRSARAVIDETIIARSDQPNVIRGRFNAIEKDFQPARFCNVVCVHDQKPLYVWGKLFHCVVNAGVFAAVEPPFQYLQWN